MMVLFICPQFENKKKAGSIQCPVVFVSGLSDQLVPPCMMLDLYTQCGSERKILLQIPNGDHNGTWTKPTYYAQLARSVEDVCSDRILAQEHNHHRHHHPHLSVHTV